MIYCESSVRPQQIMDDILVNPKQIIYFTFPQVSNESKAPTDLQWIQVSFPCFKQSFEFLVGSFVWTIPTPSQEMALVMCFYQKSKA